MRGDSLLWVGGGAVLSLQTHVRACSGHSHVACPHLTDLLWPFWPLSFPPEAELFLTSQPVHMLVSLPVLHLSSPA